METDDAAMRIWLNLLQTTRGATYETLVKVPASDKTRRAASQWRRSWEQRHAKFQHKEWYPEDQARLRSVRLANDLPRLYDGGFFVTGLYHNVFEYRGLILLDKSLIKKRGLIHGNVVGIQNGFLWPEEVGVPLPFLHLPSYNYRSVLRRDFQYKPKFASASTRGRGLDRDGIWSTGGDTFDTRFRGRTRRRQGRRRWRRATSEQPPGLFMASRLPATHALAQELIVLPRQALLDLERRVRPRSLSRTRIAEMFNWDTVLKESRTRGNPEMTCENCESPLHPTNRCFLTCRWCGAANPTVVQHEDRFPGSGNPHLGPSCPVAKRNRCKCSNFPHHVAKQCPILCSRSCGNTISPGHFKHKNAMTCASRCCMCGMCGHPGTKCKLKHCRCGDYNHLGQDCRVHTECGAQNCDRYLCGIRCQSCRLDRARLEEGVGLVGKQCPACRGVDGPVDAAAHPEDREEAGDKKRRNRRAVQVREKDQSQVPQGRQRLFVSSARGG